MEMSWIYIVPEKALSQLANLDVEQTMLRILRSISLT